MKKLKILIRGSIGNHNLGDDLLVYAITRQLEQSGISMELHYQTKNNYYPYIPQERVFQPYLFTRFDVMIYAGGTQFASFKQKKGLLKQLAALMKNPSAFVKNILGRWKKRLEYYTLQYRDVVLTGIGIGPFLTNDAQYRETILLLKKATLVIVRDELSAAICQKNNITYVFGSDLVYGVKQDLVPAHAGSSATEPAEASATEPEFVLPRKAKNIAIIVRDWQFSEERASYMDQLLRTSLAAQVTYFSFCEEKDAVSLAKIAASIRESEPANNRPSIHESESARVIIWDPVKHDVHGFCEMLGEFDLIITARYHGAVLAALHHIPFISIGIEPKLEMIARLYGMPVWEYPYAPERLTEAVRAVESDHARFAGRVAKQAAEEERKSAEMHQTLVSFLRNIAHNGS